VATDEAIDTLVHELHGLTKEEVKIIGGKETLWLWTNSLTKSNRGNSNSRKNSSPALFKTLSAFANTKGGVVFVGVSDKKEITGYRCSNADLKELSDTIVNKLSIHPIIEPVRYEGKTVLRINVKKSITPVAY
jgi:predicted HTH transcriptional regulator